VSLHARERFELVQHITFVSFRQPSFMGRLGIPFIFGPVGGGESIPPQLRRSLPLSARIAEAVRSAGNRLVAFDPLMNRSYSQASVIACATEETLLAIPAKFRNKCIVQRAIGMEPSASFPAAASRAPQSSESAPRFLFVGRLLYWKGLHLILHALHRVKQEIPGAKLKVIGEGTDRDWLIAVARGGKVADSVEWVARVSHSEMAKEYESSTCFAFPSLHDSGGMVVLEAMDAGLPVICLDRGGPGSMVDSSCGVVVKTGSESEAAIVGQLAEAMIQVACDPELRIRLAAGARKRARDLSWDAAAESIYTARVLAMLPAQRVHASR
jgi:glycosyltransferase involved in cell wall biosynthesis